MPPPIKKCVICGQEFKVKSNNQKLCGSEECKREWKITYDKSRYLENVELIEKQCVVCGKSFTTSDTRRKYCGSGKCNNKPRMKFKVKVVIR